MLPSIAHVCVALTAMKFHYRPGRRRRPRTGLVALLDQAEMMVDKELMMRRHADRSSLSTVVCVVRVVDDEHGIRMVHLSRRDHRDGSRSLRIGCE